MEPIDLGRELVGHLVPAGLVVLVGGGALLVLADVEGDGDGGGARSTSSRRSIETKPCTALVSSPEEVRSVSGSAKKAR
jgi:hypothetical protein